VTNSASHVKYNGTFCVCISRLKATSIHHKKVMFVHRTDVKKWSFPDSFFHTSSHSSIFQLWWHVLIRRNSGKNSWRLL